MFYNFIIVFGFRPIRIGPATLDFEIANRLMDKSEWLNSLVNLRDYLLPFVSFKYIVCAKIFKICRRLTLQCTYSGREHL